MTYSHNFCALINKYNVNKKVEGAKNIFYIQKTHGLPKGQQRSYVHSVYLKGI